MMMSIHSLPTSTIGSGPSFVHGPSTMEHVYRCFVRGEVGARLCGGVRAWDQRLNYFASLCECGGGARACYGLRLRLPEPERKSTVHLHFELQNSHKNSHGQLWRDPPVP